MMNTEVGFCRKVLQVFEENNVPIEHMPSGIDTLTVFVHQNEFESKEQKILAGIHRAVSPDFIELESDLALIAWWDVGCARRGGRQAVFLQRFHMQMSM